MKIEESLNYEFNNKELIDEAISLNTNLVNLGLEALNSHLSIKMSKELSHFENGLLELYYPLDVINKLKAKLSSKEYLEGVINKLNLKDIIDNPMENNLFMLALIGALALDSDNDLSNLIDKYLDLDSELIFGIDNYPNLVYEWDKRKNKHNPKYELVNDAKSSMNKLENLDKYIAKVEISAFDKPFVGTSNTKTMAVIEAFKNAYNYLKDNDLLLKITDIVSAVDSENCVNQLQELYLKGFIKEPVYKIGLKGSKGGVDIWKCRILIDGVKESFSGEDTSKKTAKRLAAYQMVEYILKNA